MGHQCLECGKTFPEGSDELLRGCPSCKGTRFYYTQAPLDAAQREALLARANRDLREVIAEIVQGGDRPDYDDPLWSLEARDAWLGRDGSRRPKGALAALPAAAAGVAAGRKAATGVAGDIAASVAASAAGAGTGPKPTPAAPAAAPSVTPAMAPDAEPDPTLEPLVRAAKAPPSRPSRGPTEQATLPAEAPDQGVAVDADAAPPAHGEDPPRPKEGKPEVVVVTEPGSYDIDVEQLLDRSPIVVRRDGVYVVHLPSVFGATSGGRKHS